MRKLFYVSLVLIVIGLLVPTAKAQEPQEEGTVQAVEPPVRVLGQGQTPEESAAFSTLEAAISFQERARLAEDFVGKFPESGLAPFAHQIAALAYHQLNDYDKFIHHAEKTVVEIPENPLLFIQLAVAYAQSNESDQAIEKAHKGLELADTIRRPPEVVPTEWESQLNQLRADGKYALGTAYLVRFSGSGKKAPDSNLEQAQNYLEQAISHDPGYDLAYFRLAFASLKQNNGEKAVKNYARAAALEGFVASQCRENLQKVYQFLNPKEGQEDEGEYSERISKELEELIATEKEYLRKKIAEPVGQ